MSLERDAPTMIRGITPGSYVVAIERESRDSDPIEFGNAEVELRAGSTTHVTIRCGHAPRTPEPVPLAGTLYIPSRWGNMRPFLFMEPVGKDGARLAGDRSIKITKSDSDSSDLLRWDAGGVLPGRYLLECEDFFLQTIVDTGPHGRSDVEIRIAEPADAVVHVVDESDGQPIASSDPERELSWNVRRPQESRAWSLGTATWDAASRSYSLRAPAGEVEFMMRDENYEYVEPAGEDRLVTLYPGSNDVTLHVRRSCGIVLLLMDGEDVVACEDDFMVSTRIRSGDGTKAVTTFSSNWKRHRIRLRAAGSYEVRVPNLAGYRPIAPFTIEVPAGTFVEHSIALERIR
jgi:hypothetical protein